MKKGLSVLMVSMTLMGAGCAYVPEDSTSPFTRERSAIIVRDWVENRSPTYTFDGTHLELVSSEQLPDCASCFEYTFEFDSLGAGYGDREDKVVAQVITPHTMVVEVWNGDLYTALTDGVFDELSAYRNAK